MDFARLAVVTQHRNGSDFNLFFNARVPSAGLLFKTGFCFFGPVTWLYCYERMCRSTQFYSEHPRPEHAGADRGLHTEPHNAQRATHTLFHVCSFDGERAAYTTQQTRAVQLNKQTLLVAHTCMLNVAAARHPTRAACRVTLLSLVVTSMLVGC